MTAPSGEIRYAFLDIGLGDCTVITWDDRKSGAHAPIPRCIVVDGGKTIEASRRLAQYLIDQEVTRIDLLVVTHIDWDHLGGITQLLERTATGGASLRAPYDRLADLPIGTYWGPLPERPGAAGHSSLSASLRGSDRVANGVSSEFKSYITSVQQNQDLLSALVGRADDLRFPAMDAVPELDLFNNLELDLLAPTTQRYSDEYGRFSPSRFQTLSVGGAIGALTIAQLNVALRQLGEDRALQAATSANNQSIVFSITPKGMFSEHRDKRLLLTGDAEEDSWTDMDALPAGRLRARYFKVPHHGAASGLGPGWQKIRPELSVLSVGQADYGHPHLPVLQRLSPMSTFIHCTERNRKDSRRPGEAGDGHGGGDGHCKLAGIDCPKQSEASWGNLVVTVATGQAGEVYEQAGDDCPFDWQT